MGPGRGRRPVVALDVDGVLNRLGGEEALADGWERHEVHVEAGDLPDSPFITGHGEHDLDLLLEVNPSLHGPWITALHNRTDVVWATTWEHAANIVLTPLLGIESLPVGISVAVQKPRFGDAIDGDVSGWKAYALEKAFLGRPLVWIDDLNGSCAHSWWGRQGQPTRVVTCDPGEGLTAAQMASVDAWLEGGVES